MSSHQSLKPEEIQRSLGFFTEPSSYVAFDRTRDGKLVRFCIDARPKLTNKRMLTAVQTAGGQVGYGYDEALVQTAVLGSPVPLEVGILDDVTQYEGRIIGDAHYGCLYVNTIEGSTEEQAYPSDQTKYNLERSLHLLDLVEDVGPLVDELSLAAASLLEYIQIRGGGQGLVEFVDKVTAGYPNVSEMEGESSPVAWIDNYAPDKGLDRETTHRVLILQGQAYHDSLGAAVADLAPSPDIRGIKAAYRAGALLLREAAVKTIILNHYPGLKQLEVIPDKDGKLKITEQKTV